MKVFSFFIICLFLLFNPYSVLTAKGIDVDQQIERIQKSLLETSSEKSLSLELPLPNGEVLKVNAIESSVMEEDLQRQYPDTKSYLISGVTGLAKGRVAVSPYGFVAVVLTDNGYLFIEPTPSERNKECKTMPYDVYYNRSSQVGTFTCEFDEFFKEEESPALKSSVPCLNLGTTLRHYRLAIASSGEFTNGIGGGSVSQTNAIINERLTALNAIFENEVAVRFTLIANNNNVIFFNAATDGLDDNNKIISAHNTITNAIGSANFDIGHAFFEIADGPGWSTSGLGGSGACVDGTKGRGWSGGEADTPLSEFMNLMAHEFGHQFEARHSFYGTDNNCGAGRIPGHGYEPGSGNSIMSYEGRCNTHNILPEKTGPYYHIHSLIAINNWVENHNCELTSAMSNTVPTVTVPADYTIPKGTPFWVEGSATDNEGDDLTYNWEQYDTDNLNLNYPQGNPIDAATSTTAPLFRSFNPSATGYKRYFPQILDVIGTSTLGETLPQVARDINLRLTVRDNYGDTGGGYAGAVACEKMTLTVSNAGPLQVTSPTSGNIVSSGSIVNFTWNTNGSSSLCSNAQIKLSVNGGLSFPYLLADNVPYNSGSLQVSIPAGVPSTTEARLMITCSDSDEVQFYALNAGDFTINSNCSAFGSFVCPDNSISANANSSSLNLGLDYFSGSSVASFDFNVNSNSPTLNFIRRDANDNCSESQDAFFPYSSNYEGHEFVVTESGTYTFVNTVQGYYIYSIFEADNFDPLHPCTSFVGTNAYDNPDPSQGTSSTSVSTTIQLNLERCTNYLLVAYNFNSAFFTNVSISGSGQVVEASQNNNSDYGYTYVAINSATNTISAIDANANFTNLSGGDYCVYGMSYKQSGAVNPPNVNLNNLLGQTIGSAFSSGACVLFSENCKPVSVTGTSAGGLFVNFKILLEGAYMSSGQMHTDLSGNIPLNQPYNFSPYNYFGGESLAAVPADMVDWVLVEARSGTPNNSGVKGTTTVETKAGVLRSNGNITDVNGAALLFENLQPTQSYYFCIRHRNHLDVLTANNFVASGTTNYDLTTATSQAFGNQQMLATGDGYAVLYTADFNHDGIIQNTDYDAWKANSASLDVYSPLDANLDGSVQVTDYDSWFPNKAKVGIVEIGF